MKYRIISLVFLIITTFGLNPLEVQAQEQDAMLLVPKQIVSDSLSTGDAHTYTVDLQADQFVYGEANQQTVDVVVTIYGPDGTRLAVS